MSYVQKYNAFIWGGGWGVRLCVTHTFRDILVMSVCEERNVGRCIRCGIYIQYIYIYIPTTAVYFEAGKQI